LAKHATHVKIGGQKLLDVMDITVDRNFFGRQVHSFKTDVAIPLLGDKPFNAVFIRAPMITDVAEGVQVLAELPEASLPTNLAQKPKRAVIVARQGRLLATVFHPELTADSRLHKYFVEEVVMKN